MNAYRNRTTSTPLLSALGLAGIFVTMSNCAAAPQGAIAYPIHEGRRYVLPVARAEAELLLGYGLTCDDKQCLDLGGRQFLSGDIVEDGATGSISTDASSSLSVRARAALQQAVIDCGGSGSIAASSLTEQHVDVKVTDGKFLKTRQVTSEGKPCCGPGEPDWDHCDGKVVVRAYETTTTIVARTKGSFSPAAGVKCKVSAATEIGAELEVIKSSDNELTLESTGWNMVDVEDIQNACPAQNTRE